MFLMPGSRAKVRGFRTGLWVPTDASGAGLVFTGISASYTRMGNMIFAYGQLTYPATVNASNAIMGGFPVPFIVANYGRGIASAYSNAGALAKLLPTPGTSTALLINNANAQITNATLTGATLIFSVAYPVS